MRIWMVKPCIFLFILNGRSVLDGVLLVVSLVDSLDTPNFLSLLFFSLLFILRVVLPLFIYCVYLVVLLNTCNLKPSLEHQPLIFFGISWGCFHIVCTACSASRAAYCARVHCVYCVTRIQKFF